MPPSIGGPGHGSQYPEMCIRDRGGLLKTVVGLLGGQFTVIIAIIAAVAGAFVILWNRSEKFRTAVMGIWQKVQPLIQAFGNLVSLIATSLAPVLSNLASLVLAGLEAAFVAFAPYIEKVIAILTSLDRKSTRLNSSRIQKSRMPSSA